MALYKHIQKTLEKQYSEKNEAYKKKLILWRKEPALVFVAEPTNVARARTVGYKAKEEIVVARVRIKKGRRMRHHVGAGRKPSKSGRWFSRAIPQQKIAEERAKRKVENGTVLGSYWAGEDGQNKFFEVIVSTCKCDCNCKC